MSCPRPGHSAPGWRVVRAGRQVTAGRTRQRWWCLSPDGTRHRFVGAVARTEHAAESVCWECDNPVARHEGPVAPSEFEYLVREVAGALVSVGQGMTYTEAAVRARRLADRARLDRDEAPKPTPKNGQTVSEWVGEFAPVVAARYEETEWPETIVCDSTRFLYTNSWTGRSKQLFCVLAVWGYPAGDPVGRLWRLSAGPTQGRDAWAELLSELPGRPKLVVCDRDYGIIGGVQKHWGRGKNAVPHHLCEHHMFARAVAALDRDHIPFEDHLHDLVKDAFHSLAGWEAFDQAVCSDPRTPATRKWVKHWRKRMRAQTARRATLPPHYSNGAVEAPLRTIAAMLDRRKFAFRNRARMIALLGLVRLRFLRADNERAYAEDIRAHLVAAGDQRARRYRGIYDPWGPSSKTKPRVRTYSLWGTSSVEYTWN